MPACVKPAIAGSNRFSDTLASFASARKSGIYSLRENVKHERAGVAGCVHLVDGDRRQDVVAQRLVDLSQFDDVRIHAVVLCVFHHQLGTAQFHLTALFLVNLVLGGVDAGFSADGNKHALDGFRSSREVIVVSEALVEASRLSVVAGERHRVRERSGLLRVFVDFVGHFS